MSILEKAYELGQEIAASKELQEMKEAEQNMMKNPEAQKIIQEFNEKQKNYMMLQQQGQPLTESQKQEVQNMEKQMLDNPLIHTFFQSQQSFEKVLEQINNIISQAITGQSPSCNDDCCTTCGGGCS